ncbi:aminotransferase class I/II-fold pyridoxal phosphate-dependent enzyme [Botrimarina colliarenosi]|uniref:aminotransferase class I/II-fold pyridoxal phosphate-dependent enzyme n=1 Tax=Botrimarina colliarenosi TaxID=2528001 RepID=UPI0011B37291|nr:aminotransferase class I/II-fold pyridoxal phosphate-dependent enzyme [Botrimarina colliarenosi]
MTNYDPAANYGLTPDIVDLVGLLRQRATTMPLQRAFTFLVDGEQQREHLTYAQLDARARAIAGYLQRRGLSGQRALLLYPSGQQFIAAFFGCLYAGVVAVPAYPPRRNRNLERIRSIIGDCHPRICLTTDDVRSRIEPLLSEMPDLAELEWKCTRELGEDDAANWRDPAVEPATLAFLQYTSGSTGMPKGVMVSHGNLLHNTKLISRSYQASPDGVGLTWLPLYHDMGLIGGILQPIYFGRPTHVMTPTHFLQKPLRWLRALSDTGATMSGGPNFAYDLCVERITDAEKKSLDLSQWQIAFNGAEPVRAETIARFTKAFAPCGFRPEAIYPCYGLAEATLMVTGGDKWLPPPIRSFDTAKLNAGVAQAVADGAEGSVRLVSSGHCDRDQEMVIADPETLAEQLPGHVGEIWVRGPSVAQGYWGREDATSETFRAHLADGRGPFMRTGDLGCLHVGDDGKAELFVNGRLKDLIILRGVNHYPQDLEVTVGQSHDDLPVGAGAAFAVGSDGAEQLVIVQEAGRNRDADFDEVCAAIRSQLGKVHEVSPREVVLIKPNSIPKTSSGKIQRHACRLAYEAGELDVVALGKPDGSVEVLRDRRRRDPIQRLTSERKPKANTPPKPEGAGLAPAGDIAPRVMDVVRSVAQERAVNLSLDTDIAGMGLDSLERMEIVAALEQEFGGRFTEEAILSMETCRDVVAQVQVCLLNELSGGLPGESNGVPTPQAPLRADLPNGQPVSAPPTTPATRATSPNEVPAADYLFAESPEYRRLKQTMELATASGLKNPYFSQHEGITADTTTIGGKQYVNFCSYNYLGMSGEPSVIDAGQQALEQFGASTSASRVVSGEKTIHRELEKAIADFIGVDDAIIMASGHCTNESVIGHLFGPGDLILHDALAHNSIIQGCKLSGALRRAFPHNDADACGKLLEQYRHEYRRVLIVIEGVYSMDGDYADIRPFVDLKEKHKAYLMIDEAHSIGTMGPTGRGMSEFWSVDPTRVDLWMGTISKGLGSCGGYIAARREIIEYLKYTAPTFVFSGGVSPANTGAALAALRLLDAEPERVAKLHSNSELFLTLAKKAGFNTGPAHGTAIVPIITGDSRLALALSMGMFERGVNVQPILHPAVEEAAARLRFFITSSHTEEQIRQSIDLLVTVRDEVVKKIAAAGPVAIAPIERGETMMAASTGTPTPA